MATKIHTSAIVDPTAVLGEGVEIGPYAVIGEKVTLGAGCVVEAGGQVHGPSKLGEENRVYPHACVGFDPQDLKYKGEETHLEVGDRNQFREFCTVHRGTGFGGGVTTIGDDNLFMVYSHVAHDCHVGSRVVMVNNATLGGHVDIDDDSTVGAFSAVHPFCKIGRHAYVGGFSVITMDALPFVKTVGQKPSCYGVNVIGLRRKGLDRETIRVLQAAIRTLLSSGLNSSQAIEELGARWPDHPEVSYLVDFIVNSKRGYIKALPGRRGERGGNGDGEKESGEGVEATP